MKRMICTLGIFLYAGVVCAQQEEHVFVIEGDSIRCNSEYVEPLYFDYQDESYSLYKSLVIQSANKAYSYTINLYDYDVAKGDGGNFRIIDLVQNGKSILCLRQSNGWEPLNSEECIDVILLDEETTALLFKGFPYPNDPELLTIIVIHKNKAKLVFNKHFILKEREKNDTGYRLVLQDQVIEYISIDQPANHAYIYHIWKEGNALKFGGPYEEIDKD